VQLDYSGWVDRRIVEHRIDVPLGEPLDEDGLEQQLTELRGLNYFGMMHYDLEPGPEASGVSIDIDEPRHGRTNLQGGGSLRTDFGGDSTFAILARHQWLALNRRAAEWVNTIQIGDRAFYSSEFHQPIDLGLRYYVRPRLEVVRLNQSLWLDGTRVAEYRVDAQEAAMRFGRFLGGWGDVHAAVFRGDEKGEPRIGISTLPSFDEDTGGVRAGFDIDTRDLSIFATRGTDLRLEVERDLEAFGATEDLTAASARLELFFSTGRSTFSPRIEATSNISGTPNITTAALVGGFQRLSGLGDNELIGEDGGVVGVDYYYEWFSFGQGPFGGKVFAGMTLESGSTYLEGDPITWSSLRSGAALWVGAATSLGPIYLGWGWTDPDRNRAYLIIGDRF